MGFTIVTLLISGVVIGLHKRAAREYFPVALT